MITPTHVDPNRSLGGGIFIWIVFAVAFWNGYRQNHGRKYLISGILMLILPIIMYALNRFDLLNPILGLFLLLVEVVLMFITFIFSKIRQ